MSYQDFFLHTHTGLGDLFVQEAIIRHYAQIGRNVYFTTEYPAEAERLFAGCSGRVKPIKVERHYPERHKVPSDLQNVTQVGFGFYEKDFQEFGRYYFSKSIHRTFDPQNWDREFYRQAEIPFMLRWTGCRLPTPAAADEELKKQKCVIMVHDDPDYRIQIRVSHVHIEPGIKKNALDWMPYLQRATEIHCIDSAFLNLVESMNACNYLNPRTKLFFYRAVRKTPPPTLMAPWMIME